MKGSGGSQKVPGGLRGSKSTITLGSLG